MAKKRERINWQRRAEELAENWKRALADYKNLVRRMEEERGMIVRFANAELLLKLLPVVDLLNKAARHSRDKGMVMAVEQIRRLLEEEGVEMIEPKLGEQFDEVRYECSETVVGGRSGEIAELVEVGYKWKDGMVLRPAKVKVYK